MVAITTNLAKTLGHCDWHWTELVYYIIVSSICCSLLVLIDLVAGPSELDRLLVAGTISSFYVDFFATLFTLLGLLYFQLTLSWKILCAAICGVGSQFALTGQAAQGNTAIFGFQVLQSYIRRSGPRGVGSLIFLAGLTVSVFLVLGTRLTSCCRFQTFETPDTNLFNFCDNLHWHCINGGGSPQLLTGQHLCCILVEIFAQGTAWWRRTILLYLTNWTLAAFCGVGSLLFSGRKFFDYDSAYWWFVFWLGTTTDCPNNLEGSGHQLHFEYNFAYSQGGLLVSDSHWPIILIFRQTLELFWWFATRLFRLHRFVALLLAQRALEWQLWWWRLPLFIWHHIPDFSFCRTPTGQSLSAQKPDLKTCRSGPKSRYNSTKIKGWHWLLFLPLIAMSLRSCWGEGCNSATGVTEVPPGLNSHPFSGTKQRGKQPPVCNRTTCRPETDGKISSKVEKRSLHRAHRRACLTGSAWYRGRHYTKADFERMGCPPPTLPDSVDLTQPQRHDWQQCNRRHVTKGRLHFWQWNSGGLSTATMDEVKAWLVLNCVDVGVILETRLTFDAQWSDQHWNILHSGEGEHRGRAS